MKMLAEGDRVVRSDGIKGRVTHVRAATSRADRATCTILGDDGLRYNWVARNGESLTSEHSWEVDLTGE